MLNPTDLCYNFNKKNLIYDSLEISVHTNFNFNYIIHIIDR